MLGENQQIVATEWMGRSPKDIQDQITYPSDNCPAGYSRSTDRQEYLHVRDVIHLHHFQG
ncbi:MAG: hypothetical protein MZV63_57060 [Marinilabiliales bacterium]|nr:hypothetical protein [Marinilabiliales bacterium]